MITQLPEWSKTLLYVGKLVERTPPWIKTRWGRFLPHAGGTGRGWGSKSWGL